MNRLLEEAQKRKAARSQQQAQALAPPANMRPGTPEWEWLKANRPGFAAQAEQVYAAQKGPQMKARVVVGAEPQVGIPDCTGDSCLEPICSMGTHHDRRRPLTQAQLSIETARYEDAMRNPETWLALHEPEKYAELVKQLPDAPPAPPNGSVSNEAAVAALGEAVVTSFELNERLRRLGG